MLEKIKELWGKLPAEIKVAAYIASSYGLSAVVVELGKINVDNVWLAILINILLVFLKELSPRLERLRNR